jgi:hypothetical protein
MTRNRLIWFLSLLICFVGGCSSADNLAEDTDFRASLTPTIIPTLTPTHTPIPTYLFTSTPEPTFTQPPTDEPTLAPETTSTLTPSPLPTLILNEEILIQQVFEQYRSALLQGDGEAALAALDLETIDWYEQVIEFALTLDRDDLNRLDFIEKFTVLRLRHEFSRDELEDLTGDELIKIAIENGWISRSSVESLELEDVEVNDLRGIVTITGISEPLFLFVKEDGQWKFMLWKVTALGNPAFEQLVAESGLSEDEFVIGILEALSSFQVDERIFDGPIDY